MASTNFNFTTRQGYGPINSNPPEVNFNPAPQANPIDAALQGLERGQSLGLRQKQFEILKQEEARKQQQFEADQKQRAIENIKVKSDLYNTKWFKGMGQDDKNAFHKGFIKDLNHATGMEVDENSTYHDNDAETADMLGELFKDKNLHADDRRAAAASILSEAQKRGSDKEYLDSLRSTAELGLGTGKYADKTSTPSYVFQGFQGGDPVFSNNKSPHLVTGTSTGQGTFLPKAEPAKLAKETADNNQVSTIADEMTRLLAGSSGLKGGLKQIGAKVTAGAIAPDIRTYETQKPAYAVKLYRALTGDTRLSDADAAARALPLLPDPYEPADVQLAKINAMRKSAGTKNEIIQKLLTGQNIAPAVPAFSSEKEKRYQEWKAKHMEGQ